MRHSRVWAVSCRCFALLAFVCSATMISSQQSADGGPNGKKQIVRSEEEIDLANRVFSMIGADRAEAHLPPLARLATLDTHPFCVQPIRFVIGHYTYSKEMREQGYGFEYIFDAEDPTASKREIRDVASSNVLSEPTKLKVAVEVCKVVANNREMFRTVIAFHEKDVGLCTNPRFKVCK